MNIKYLVVVNNAEHSGFTSKQDYDKIWCTENPNGWTYQDITGPYGHVFEERDTKAEAIAILDKWLECNAEENDTYCYTHNSI